MGVRTVDLLRALRDRPRSRPDEIADRLRRDETQIRQLLTSCALANVAQQDRKTGCWTLTRQGRQLLEAHERRAESIVSVKLDWMMRSNRGLVAA